MNQPEPSTARSRHNTTAFAHHRATASGNHHPTAFAQHRTDDVPAADAGGLEHRSGVERTWGERGQATAEYALVLLGAAAVALMLAAWAAESGAIGRLFDTVLDQLVGRAG